MYSIAMYTIDTAMSVSTSGGKGGSNVGKYDPKAPPAKQFRNPLHCVECTDDGLVYVCDRANHRVQVFNPDGTFVKEASTRRATNARCIEGPLNG